MAELESIVGRYVRNVVAAASAVAVAHDTSCSAAQLATCMSTVADCGLLLLHRFVVRAPHACKIMKGGSLSLSWYADAAYYAYRNRSRSSENRSSSCGLCSNLHLIRVRARFVCPALPLKQNWSLVKCLGSAIHLIHPSLGAELVHVGFA